MPSSAKTTGTATITTIADPSPRLSPHVPLPREGERLGEGASHLAKFTELPGACACGRSNLRPNPRSLHANTCTHAQSERALPAPTRLSSRAQRGSFQFNLRRQPCASSPCLRCPPRRRCRRHRQVRPRGRSHRARPIPQLRLHARTRAVAQQDCRAIAARLRRRDLVSAALPPRLPQP